MGRPQQPELARSGKTDLDPDHIGTELESRKAPDTKGRTGPVPPANQPGHHPVEEADKPDLDAFAAKLGADTEDEDTPAAAKADTSTTAEEDTHATAKMGTSTTAEADTPDTAQVPPPAPAARPRTLQDQVWAMAHGGLRFAGRTLGGLQERATALWRDRR